MTVALKPYVLGGGKSQRGRIAVNPFRCFIIMMQILRDSATERKVQYGFQENGKRHSGQEYTVTISDQPSVKMVVDLEDSINEANRKCLAEQRREIIRQPEVAVPVPSSVRTKRPATQIDKELEAMGLLDEVVRQRKRARLVPEDKEDDEHDDEVHL